MQPPTATAQTSSPISVSLLTTFGLGRSYLFYAERNHSANDCWPELFQQCKGWSFDRLKRYDKPLGETVMFTFTPETHAEASAIIEELQRACKEHVLAQIDGACIQATFFTTGVAILNVRLVPLSLDDPMECLDRIQDDAHLKEVRSALLKIIKCCAASYLTVLEFAEKDKRSASQRGWTLKRFRTVDREDWQPQARHSYPLLFVTDDVYQKRTESILQQVASQNRQRRQSDRARVSYQGAEIYVDWSEALVKNAGKSSHELIENNFVIGLASWFALILMNKNSSFFLFEAFLGMVDKKHRSNAEAVHQRQMAYKDVADASLPIRWTRQRRDLFLLETIHRNWSSERSRNNIEERMKLLSLHYKNLEDENNERANRRLAFAAVFIALITLSSAITDVMALKEESHGSWRWLYSLVPVLIAIPVAVWWFHLPSRIWRKING